MAAKGQCWTEEQRLASEDKAFWLERVALLYTIMVAPLDNNPCLDANVGVGPAKLYCFLNLLPHYWLFPLISAFAIAAVFYTCQFCFSQTGSSLEDVLRPATVPSIERIIFWMERVLITLSFVMVPKGSVAFRLCVMLYGVSFLASLIYLACFLDRMSFLRWFISHDDHDDTDKKDNGKNQEESGECSKCGEYCEESCEKMLAYWEAQFEKLRNEESVKCSKNNIQREEEDCGRKCEESCEKMLAYWEAEFVKLRNEWLTSMTDCIKESEKLRNEWWRNMNEGIIETEEKLKRAQDAHHEERRKWEQEKVQLDGKLSAAIASTELYRSLLHESGFFLDE